MKQGDVEGAILAAKRDQLKFTRIANEPLTEPTIDPRSLISLSQQRLAFLEIGISELDGGNGVPLLNPEVYRKRFTSLEKALSEYQAKKDQLIKLFEAAKENHQVQSDVNESEACIERYLAVGRRLDEIADQFHEATAQRDSLIALCSYLTTNGRDQSKWDNQLISAYSQVRKLMIERMTVQNEFEVLQCPLGEKLLVDEKLAALEENTHKELVRISKQMEFIKAHSELFVISACKKRWIHHGALMRGKSIVYTYKGKEKIIDAPGKGVVVSVIDENMIDKPVPQPLRLRMTDPKQRCLSTAQGDSLHATMVASVIGVKKDKEAGVGKTIGIASSAKVQLVPFYEAKVTKVDRICSGENKKLFVPRICSVLDDFDEGGRVMKLNRLLYKLYDEDKTLSLVEGPIANLSRGEAIEKHGAVSIYALDWPIEYLFFFWKLMAMDKKLLIQSTGNNGIVLASTTIRRCQKAFAKHPSTRYNMIAVTALAPDALHIASYTNVPGDDWFLQDRTVAAVGSEVPVLHGHDEGYKVIFESGTSLSTPFVSSIAAIIKGEFPNLSQSAIATCILDSASPIILLGDVPSFQSPVQLDVMAYQFTHPRTYTGLDGTVYEVNEDIISQSRSIYGRGKIHINRALYLASILDDADCSGVEYHTQQVDWDALKNRV